MAERARAEGCTRIIVPSENAAEAAAAGLDALPVEDLRAVMDLLEGREVPAAEPVAATPSRGDRLDLSDVKGQPFAKRALEVAAAGGHNLLLIGTPGVGKSMLARRIPGMLPPLRDSESIEVTKIHSVFGGVHSGLIRERPFRTPHHTCSVPSLIGGGPAVRPGEISLAHCGVLFLDELAEFPQPMLEALRQPLEDHRVTIARAKDVIEFPARFQLVAAMNPCPCGWRGHPIRSCACAPFGVARYLNRLSGPMLDRIDIQVEAAAVSFEEWSSRRRESETTAAVRARVIAARESQNKRWGDNPSALNAFAPSGQLFESCGLDAQALKVLAQAERHRALSARALDRVLRVGRTIADLAGAERVEAGHLSEALAFRGLDRLRSGLEAHP